MKNAKRFKVLEKGMSNKDIPNKCSANTLSSWFTNKETFFDALEKGTNAKRQKLKTGYHELMD